MLKRETVIRELIANGYDDALATQLPKLFIEDFFDKEQEKLSEALDIFIDKVQTGIKKPDAYGNVVFGTVQKMTETDINGKSKAGIFYNFQSQIANQFNYIVTRQPLQNILLSGGAMKFYPELQVFSKNPVRFEKEIVGIPEEYKDLCLVDCYGVSNLSSYIKANNFYLLLLSKGFSEEAIAHLFGEKGMKSKYSSFGVHLKYDDVMKIGNTNIKSTTYAKK